MGCGRSPLGGRASEGACWTQDSTCWGAGGNQITATGRLNKAMKDKHALLIRSLRGRGKPRTMQQQERPLPPPPGSVPPSPSTDSPNIVLERKKGLPGLVQASSTEQRKMFMELRGNKLITCINVPQRLTDLCTRIHTWVPTTLEHFHTVKCPWALFCHHPLLFFPTKATGCALGVGRFLWRTLLCQLCPRPDRVSDLREPPPGTPAPCLTFAPLGHSSYSLVQSERRLRASENMKSVCLNLLVLLKGFLKRRKEKYLKSEISGQKL